jgi:hypothetical protein
MTATPNPLAPNPRKITNYSALQNFVDSNTTGIDSSGNQVSLVFNDVTQATAANTTGNGATPTVATPAVPATTVVATNTTGADVNVYIIGGTITQVKVNTVLVGTGAGSYYLPAGATISITYSVAPTWVWQAENGVAPAGYVELVVGGVLVKIPFLTA